MTRRTFLGSLAAIVFAPDIPTPARDHTHTTWATQLAVFNSGDGSINDLGFGYEMDRQEDGRLAYKFICSNT